MTRHEHKPSSTTTGVSVPRPDGGFGRADFEACACGAWRTVTVLTPPADADGAEEVPTVLPGLWSSP